MLSAMRPGPALLLLLLACSPHQEGRVEVRNDDCVLCHQLDFDSAEAPPHSGIFPVAVCAQCHQTTAWAPATFSHDSVTSVDCVTCHITDYEQTADPVHPGNFPTTCDSCHVTSAWRPALDGIHPESAFPIENGPHEKFECTDCHDPALGPSTDGMNTDCIGCHTGEHRESEVRDQHQEVPDFSYTPAMPNFCLECHPNGRD